MQTTLILAALALVLGAAPAAAGTIGQACLRSDRQAVSRAVCGCLQQVADMTLRNADQRRVARFFADPEEAQKVRNSTSERDNALWQRYRNFGATAEAVCAR